MEDERVEMRKSHRKVPQMDSLLEISIKKRCVVLGAHKILLIVVMGVWSHFWSLLQGHKVISQKRSNARQTQSRGVILGSFSRDILFCFPFPLTSMFTPTFFPFCVYMTEDASSLEALVCLIYYIAIHIPRKKVTIDLSRQGQM